MTYEVVLSYDDNSENEKVVDIHIKSTNVTILHIPQQNEFRVKKHARE